MANVKKTSASGVKSAAKAKKVEAEAVQTETNMDAIKKLVQMCKTLRLNC